MKCSNTAGEQRKVPGVPFTKNDPRINRKGRPRSFDQVRALAQQIAHEALTPHGRTQIESILRRWANSLEPSLQRAFVEYAFGKVPDKIEGEVLSKKTFVLHYDHERPGRNGSRIPSTVSQGSN